MILALREKRNEEGEKSSMRLNFIWERKVWPPTLFFTSADNP